MGSHQRQPRPVPGSGAAPRGSGCSQRSPSSTQPQDWPAGLGASLRADLILCSQRLCSAQPKRSSSRRTALPSGDDLRLDSRNGDGVAAVPNEPVPGGRITLAPPVAAQECHQPQCRSKIPWPSLTVLDGTSAEEIQLVLDHRHVRLAEMAAGSSAVWNAPSAGGLLQAGAGAELRKPGGADWHAVCRGAAGDSRSAQRPPPNRHRNL